MTAATATGVLDRADRVDRSGPPLIHAEGIWKIFGPRSDRVLGTPDAELTRSELREKTGCVAAVRDVSFDVWPGKSNLKGYQ